MPLGSRASSLAWVLSAGLPRRWAVDRCQADGERDQRARGAKEDRHHRDEQPAEQVSKTGSGLSVRRGFESLPLRWLTHALV